MSVKVIEKNAGEKIPFTESGYKLNFDDMLAIKCDKYQKDWPVHKDICMDADGDLTMGTGDGLFYVAEVDIPAREYRYFNIIVRKVSLQKYFRTFAPENVCILLEKNLQYNDLNKKQD